MAGKQTRLDEFIPYRMAVTANAVTDLISGEYKNEFGLKIPEWRVLAVLGDAGSLTQRELVRVTLMDKVAVNRACKVLVDRGLVSRSPNVADGRSHHLVLTEAGRAMYDRLWPQAQEIYERIFSALTERETQRLRVMLDKLLKAARVIEGERR